MKLALLGDSAVLVTLGETPDVPTVAEVRALAAALDAKPLPGLIECAQTNASVTVFYDPARVPARECGTTAQLLAEGMVQSFRS